MSKSASVQEKILMELQSAAKERDAVASRRPTIDGQQAHGLRPGPAPFVTGLAFGNISFADGPIVIKNIAGDHNVSTSSNNTTNHNSGNVTSTRISNSNNVYAPGNGEPTLFSVICEGKTDVVDKGGLGPIHIP